MAAIPVETAPLATDEVDLTAMSLDEVLRHLAASHTHDTRDNDQFVEDRIAALVSGDLVSWCYEVAVPTQMILERLGYTARIASFVAFDLYDDGTRGGHHVVELWHPEWERWVVVDIDYGRMYDQPAATLGDGRVEPILLEDAPLDPEVSTAYPKVLDGFALNFRYDPAQYTAEQVRIMDEAFWQPEPDFDRHFYSPHLAARYASTSSTSSDVSTRS